LGGLTGALEGVCSGKIDGENKEKSGSPEFLFLVKGIEDTSRGLNAADREGSWEWWGKSIAYGIISLLL